MNNLRNAKIIVIIMIGLFSLSAPVFAGTEVIGLEQALELALEKNLDLEIAELDLKDARIDYEKNQLGNLLTDSHYVKLQGELALVRAEDNFSNTKEQIIIDLIGQYLQLIQLKQGIKTGEREVDLTRQRLEEVKAQVEVGYKGRLDLFDKQNEYQSAVLELEKEKDERMQLLREFKIKTGLSQDEELNLPRIDQPRLWEVKEEEVIEQAVQNNSLLIIKNKQVELANFDLTRASAGAVPALDLKKIENSLKRARLEERRAINGVENIAQEQYYRFKQAVKLLGLNKQNLLQAREEYQVIREQHTAGLVTGNELLGADVNQLQAEEDYLAAIINYYLNQLELQQIMGLEPGVKLNVLE